MNKEEIIKDFINYLNQDIQHKDFLTYQEQDEWKDYINRIIDNQVKEKDKEIKKLNNIINELEKDMQQEVDEGRPLEKGKPEKYLWLMGYFDASKDYLTKLQELKGSDK